MFVPTETLLIEFAALAADFSVVAIGSTDNDIDTSLHRQRQR